MILNNAHYCNVYLNYHQEKNIKICLPLPLYHCFGMVLGSLATICHGISVVFPSDAYSGEACLKAIEKERCTSMYGTPTMFVDMINNPNLKKYDLSSFSTGDWLFDIKNFDKNYIIDWMFFSYTGWINESTRAFKELYESTRRKKCSSWLWNDRN